MHTFVTVCGVTSMLLAIFSGIPYALSILRGRTKPHQLTCLIFTIMNGIAFISQFLEGARASVLIAGVFFVYSAVNLGLSFKYGVRNSSRYDRLLFGLALATIVLWLFTRSNGLAIWLTVLIGALAISMLILKLRAHPGSEPFWLWLIVTVAFVFSVLSLANKPFGILYVRPLYSMLSDTAVLAAILYFRPRGGKKTKPEPDFPEVV